MAKKVDVLGILVEFSSYMSQNGGKKLSSKFPSTLSLFPLGRPVDIRFDTDVYCGPKIPFYKDSGLCCCRDFLSIRIYCTCRLVKTRCISFTSWLWWASTRHIMPYRWLFYRWSILTAGSRNSIVGRIGNWLHYSLLAKERNTVVFHSPQQWDFCCLLSNLAIGSNQQLGLIREV